MRLYHENTEQYIYALAESISKDPASLENWRCIHIHPMQATILSPAYIQGVMDLFKHLDCDMVICEDLDILLISRENTLSELAGHIMHGLPAKSEMQLYDLVHDWRIIRPILLTKTLQDTIVPAPLHTKPDFGEVNHLSDVFCEAKKLRKHRQPQYVMVVDDDPLTRRLVTTAFKEKYALITACDAQEAVANYLLHAPDVVFLDIGLPSINGFSVLQQLIASDPDAYIVMFSGNSYLDNVTAALNAGAAGFVAKPFKKEKLRYYIEDSAMHHQKFCA